VLQFAPWNIRVNSIHPAKSPIPGSSKAADRPMGREGLARECAHLVVFLASEESSFISGAEIAIDGGYIAAGLRNRVRADYGRASE
jgi:3alpha(or 20beta)-hydroxysteroid dehydrogenase